MPDPLVPLRPEKPPPPLPVRKAKPPPPLGAPLVVLPPPPVHVPVELGVVRVMLRAAMVVFDFFDGVPVTVTQSPAARELTVSVTVFENWVVVVQFTVVCPLLAFWTSMLEPLSAATLPVAPMGAVAVAAPAAEATAVAATSAVAPVPRNRAQRRRVVLRLVRVCIGMVPLSLLCVWCSDETWSFVPEGVDRRQGGRPAGRVDAEQDADGQSDDQRADRRGRAGGDGIADQTG